MDMLHRQRARRRRRAVQHGQRPRHLERRADKRASRQVRDRQAAGTGDAEQRPEARLRARPHDHDQLRRPPVASTAAARPRYRSILVRFPERGMSVAVLCNAGEASDDRDGFAARIFDLFMAADGVRPPAAPPPATHRRRAASKVWTFRQGRTLLQRADRQPAAPGAANGRLVVAGGGPLVAVTKDRFRIARPHDGLHVEGRVRAARSSRGPVRIQVDGRPDDAVSTRAAVGADRRRS